MFTKTLPTWVNSPAPERRSAPATPASAAPLPVNLQTRTRGDKNELNRNFEGEQQQNTGENRKNYRNRSTEGVLHTAVLANTMNHRLLALLLPHNTATPAVAAVSLVPALKFCPTNTLTKRSGPRTGATLAALWHQKGRTLDLTRSSSSRYPHRQTRSTTKAGRTSNSRAESCLGTGPVLESFKQQSVSGTAGK